MSDAKPHLKTLEEIERGCLPGLVEVLREEGVEGVRCALWDMTGTATTPSVHAGALNFGLGHRLREDG